MVEKLALEKYKGSVVTLKKKNEDVFYGVLMIGSRSRLPFVRKVIWDHGESGNFPVYVRDNIGLSYVKSLDNLKVYGVV